MSNVNSFFSNASGSVWTCDDDGTCYDQFGNTDEIDIDYGVPASGSSGGTKSTSGGGFDWGGIIGDTLKAGSTILASENQRKAAEAQAKAAQQYAINNPGATYNPYLMGANGQPQAQTNYTPIILGVLGAGVLITLIIIATRKKS